jgi:hypothetical protein
MAGPFEASGASAVGPPCGSPHEEAGASLCKGLGCFLPPAQALRDGVRLHGHDERPSMAVVLKRVECNPGIHLCLL